MAYLCRNRLSGSRVVIKALEVEELERDADTVLGEVHVLDRLDHPAIIRLRDCGYADPAAPDPWVARPVTVGVYPKR